MLVLELHCSRLKVGLHIEILLMHLCALGLTWFHEAYGGLKSWLVYEARLLSSVMRTNNSLCFGEARMVALATAISPFPKATVEGL